MRRGARVLVRIGIVVGSLLLFLIVASVILLSSTGIAKRVVRYALGSTAQDRLEVREIEGPLAGPLRLIGIEYRAGGLSVEVDTLLIDWQPTRLLLGRLELSRVMVAGAHVILPDSTPRDTAGTARARRPRPSTPLPVYFGDVSVRRVQIDAPGDVILRADSMWVDGRAQAYGFSIHGTVDAPRLENAPVQLTGVGNLEQIELRHASARLYDGELRATGSIAWWPDVAWRLVTQADSIRPELTHPALHTWPGRVGIRAETWGMVDSTGLAGTARIDSVLGMLRGLPLGGEAEIDFSTKRVEIDSLAARWGTSQLAASGTIADQVALSYAARIENLSALTPAARGQLEVQGTATGPIEQLRVQAELEGSNLASGSNRIRSVTGRVDVELGPRGRTEAVFRGQDVVVVGSRFATMAADLHGSRPAHRLSARLQGANDTIRLAARGGLEATTWRGMLDTLALRITPAGGWRLVSPSALVVSPSGGRIQQLCVRGDSAGEQICAQGDWRGARNWNMLATIDGIRASRFGSEAPRWFRRDGALAGTLNARLEAHATRGLLDGTLRASADTVAFLYSEANEIERRLGLDSAVVAIRSDASATVATLGVRVIDERQRELLVLSGNANLPPYRIGTPLGGQRIEVRVDGTIPTLEFLEPLLLGVDSLAGTVVLTATAQGTLAAPRVEGRLAVEQLGIGLPAHRSLGGSAELAVNGRLEPNRALTGEVRLSTRQFAYNYWYYTGKRRLDVDSGVVVVHAGAEGLRGNLGISLSEQPGTALGSISGTIALPEFRRLSQPLGPQPWAASLEAHIPDLRVLQPFVLRVDSLAGRLDLNVAADGRVNAPNLTGTLELASFRGRLPTGALAQGGLAADLRFDIAANNTMSGRFVLEPRDVTFTVPTGETPRPIQVEGKGVELTADGSGTRGTLDLRMVDGETGAQMAVTEGRLALPGLTRVNEPLSPQPVEGSLEMRADDLAFLAAMTALVDSSAGRARVNARVSGTLGEMRMLGSVSVNDAATRLPRLGILVENIQFTGQGEPAGLIDVEGSMESGGGTLSFRGTTPVLPSATRPGRLELRGNRFEAMDNAQLHAVVTPNLTARLTTDSISIQGRVEVPLARLVIEALPEIAVWPSEDVVVMDSVVARPSRPLAADIEVALGDSVSLSAFHFDAELSGTVRIRQATDQIATATGTLRIEEGRYRAYGQDLSIRGGEVRYTGGPLNNPGIAITATRTARTGEDTVVVGLRVTGTAKSPSVNLFSSPAMSDSRALSYLLTGRAGGSGVGGNLVNRALTSLGLKGGSLLAGALGSQVGLQEATLSTADDFRGTALQIGRSLAPNLYLSYAIGVFDPVSTFRLRYVLSSRLTLLAETGRESSADILIRKEP